ncbi:S24 family peptidase [Pedobacter sp. MW01-1-1]|uniref:S24 family peptidase n=1 Tax=Pedobacter sp. MW01-1-1 TaxID=3383027 RepID=UPI003FEE90D3
MKAIERLKQYIDYKELTNSSFEKKNGLSNGYIATQLKRNADLGESVFNKILDNCLDINPVWLLTGNGEMITDKEPPVVMIESPPNHIHLSKTEKLYNEQTIPLYDFKASAGLVSLFKEKENVLDHIRIPNLPKADGAISIVGDSMYPLLKSGDIVIYKTVHNYLENIFWGEMYLLSYSNHGDDIITVKYIQKSEKGEEWVRLVSQNTHHQPKEVKLKFITALALIKASIRINNMY